MPSTTCLSQRNVKLAKGHNSHKIFFFFFSNVNQVIYCSALKVWQKLLAQIHSKVFCTQGKVYRMKEWTKKAKAICPLTFFEGGGIKNTI